MNSLSKTDPWWKEGLRFSCLGCGACCRGEPGVVWVSPDEERAIAASLGIDMVEFELRYLWKRYGRRSLRERSNYDCIFLDRDPDRCRIRWLDRKSVV